MRVIDKDGKTIKNYDLTKGFLAPTVAIKTDATPIDNIKKFAWYDEDYEPVQMFIEKPLEEINTPPVKSVEERLTALEDLIKKLLKTKG